MLKIFIGYDEREHDAYMVCAESIRNFTSIPVAIMPLRQSTLRDMGHYKRPKDEPASTEFAFTRFLVPRLCDYRGHALYIDCDFLFTQNIRDMLMLLGADSAVSVVKHDYVPKAQWKMDGQPQTTYPRKNWSSLMFFNNEKCSTLTKGYINTAPAADLHRFAWVEDKDIAEIPQTWNWLEGEYEWDSIKPPAAIHFTNGGPWHANHTAVRFGDLWMKAREEMKTKGRLA